MSAQPAGRSEEAVVVGGEDGVEFGSGVAGEGDERPAGGAVGGDERDGQAGSGVAVKGGGVGDGLFECAVGVVECEVEVGCVGGLCGFHEYIITSLEWFGHTGVTDEHDLGPAAF